MNIAAFFSVIAAVIYLVVAIFVYSKSRSNPINRSFAIWLLCVSVWNIDIVGIRIAPNPEFADLWGKVFRTGLLFIPPTMLHFFVLFTTPSGLSPKYRKTLVAFYLLSVFFSIINWTPYFTGEIKETKWGYQVISGPLYPLFFIQFLASIGLGMFFLFRGFRIADSYQRHRLKYFFLAISISLILGGLGFLPVFGFEIFPFGRTCGFHRLNNCGLFRCPVSFDGRKPIHVQRDKLFLFNLNFWHSIGIFNIISPKSFLSAG